MAGNLHEVQFAMKNIDTEGIIRLLVSQCRGADLWISQWERFKDASSVRNAAMALGKIQGVYNVLLTMNGGDEDVPPQVLELMKKYGEVWDHLGVEK